MALVWQNTKHKLWQYQWIKKLGENVSLPIRDKSVDIIDLDEIHSYIGVKN